ncbi:MAG TPA: SpoVA/SpoVAEb family sporulation membrane protein [Bacillota bacterium]|nr:SpoVA/SpoVAEb family sporulation membrane protein [Bacillota bacterium]
MPSQKAKKQMTKMPETIQEVQEQTRRQKVYQQLVAERKPKPPYLRNFLVAFMTGGGICAIGQVVLGIFMERGQDISAASAPTLAIMIFLGIVLTAFGIYDEFAEFAGAGAAVPITGFANTIAASAIDFKHEGWVLGMGSKMFIIAGPVIVYGILSGVFAAFIKFITRL